MTGLKLRKFWQYVQLIVILIGAAIMIIPIIWIFMAAFKTHVDVYQLKIWFRPTLENFAVVFDPPYYLLDKLINSTIVATVTVLIAIPVATCAS